MKTDWFMSDFLKVTNQKAHNPHPPVPKTRPVIFLRHGGTQTTEVTKVAFDPITEAEGVETLLPNDY